MMTKKVQFANKAKENDGEVAEFKPDDWVSTGNKEKPDLEPAIVRFSIDIPTDLHTRIKANCATRRVKMKLVIQAILEREFPPSSAEM
jgi:hypothetical protein